MEPDLNPAPATKRRRGAKLGSSNRRSHGFYQLKNILDGTGLDGRSVLYHALRLKEKELITALGGDPSPQERAIIGDTVKVMMYLSTCDNYLVQLKSFIRKSRPHPVLSVRLQLASHLRENLRLLGLKRQAKTMSLEEYVECKYGNGRPESEGEQ